MARWAATPIATDHNPSSRVTGAGRPSRMAAQELQVLDVAGAVVVAGHDPVVVGHLMRLDAADRVLAPPAPPDHTLGDQGLDLALVADDRDLLLVVGGLGRTYRDRAGLGPRSGTRG